MQKSCYITRAFRLARLFIHICIGLIIAGGAWPLLSAQKKRSITRWWCSGALSCFNITISTHGKLPNANTQSTMFVANHISWMDIHAINSVIPLQFIAKSEVSQWPVFGYLVRKSGTVFIDRGRRKDAVRIIEVATDELKKGVNIGFFPEGTTTEGKHLEKFKSSIAQAAINAEAILWPIALRYPLPDGSANTQMAYAGDTSLGESIFNILAIKEPAVELYFLTPMNAADCTNRQELTEMAYRVIAQQLNL